MYDSILFHRVIESFMIQAGESTDQKKAESKRRSRGFPQTIAAEITPHHFHKRGALGAARMRDDVNPSRDGSDIQFYIVGGKSYTDSTLALAEHRINNMLAYNHVINNPTNKPAFEKLQELRKISDSTNEKAISQRKDELDSLTEIELEAMQLFQFP
jgi:cyclophilin family peptidyl-prolyl cis-trans isomerase